MYNFEEIKDILKQYEGRMYNIYDTANNVGDIMDVVYKKNGVTIKVCREYGYIEIFGITEEEYFSLCEEGTKLKIS